MSAPVITEELDIVSILQESGFSVTPAKLAVVMVDREHTRSEPELVSILRQYQNLEELLYVFKTISELKLIGLFVTSIG